MDRFELQKLRDLPIEGVAERLGLSVSRHKCLCPWHTDKHPSLSFNRARNSYRCFVCGVAGNGPIDLVMQYLHKDFRDACQWLADENNIILTIDKQREPDVVLKPFDASRYEHFFACPVLSAEAQRFLFGERMLNPAVVRWCRLTSWSDRNGVPWLQTPYYDRQGHLIGIQNRNLVKGATPRFKFPYGARCSIYNLPVLNLLKPGEALYITEGASDCWAMLSAGHKAIAIPSATLLSDADAETLSSLSARLHTEFHMYPDSDAPGERLFMQLQQILPSLEHHQLPLGCKDFSDYYVREIRSKADANTNILNP